MRCRFTPALLEPDPESFFACKKGKTTKTKQKIKGKKTTAAKKSCSTYTFFQRQRPLFVKVGENQSNSRECFTLRTTKTTFDAVLTLTNEQISMKKCV